MPVINVSLLSGRTQDDKRKIVKALTDAYCSVSDLAPENVVVILTEVEANHWARADTFVSDR